MRNDGRDSTIHCQGDAVGDGFSNDDFSPKRSSRNGMRHFADRSPETGIAPTTMPPGPGAQKRGKGPVDCYGDASAIGCLGNKLFLPSAR